MPRNNTDEIKDAIVAGRDAGRCDRDGKKATPGGGKGDRFRPVSKAYSDNYDRIKWFRKECEPDG